jgi:hypothetical protein
MAAASSVAAEQMGDDGAWERRWPSNERTRGLGADPSLTGT